MSAHSLAAVPGLHRLPIAALMRALPTRGANAVNVAAALDELRAINLMLAKIHQTLRQQIPATLRGSERLPLIIGEVEKRFKLCRGALRGPSRLSHISWPRQLAIYCAREFTDLTTVEIAACFKRDHSSICIAARTARNRAETAPNTAGAELEALREYFNKLFNDQT